jgi:hypothetical protein
MSVARIPEKVKIRLWGKSAGRCQYPGCNKVLWRDGLTKVEFNTAYIAHIIAAKPNGPRGDIKLSKILAKDINNLMLLCDDHHRLIDKEKIDEHPVELLRKYKKEHEDRIERVTGIIPERRTYAILYGANIGEQSSPLNKQKVYNAIVKNEYNPAESDPIELSLKNSAMKDDTEEFWRVEKENLNRLFDQKVRYRLKDGLINHLSIFGIAPQPLLIWLGCLLSDMPTAEVYQLHRSPPDWVWDNNQEKVEYRLIRAEKKGDEIALALSLSQKIDPRKIVEVIGEDIPLWTVTISEPNNEFLRNRKQLEEFRILFKKILSEIKYNHGDTTIIHVFPTVPVSVAIEIGRARLPKVDLPMIIYDYNKKRGGFVRALHIE